MQVFIPSISNNLIRILIMDIVSLLSSDTLCSQN